jgi:hypothetical protein
MSQIFHFRYSDSKESTVTDSPKRPSCGHADFVAECAICVRFFDDLVYKTGWRNIKGERTNIQGDVIGERDG